MADYGIKVSQPGYDVATATPSQLVFSSKYQTLKIHSQGSGTLTDSSRTATIAHGLGYVPTFLVHAQQDPQMATEYGGSTSDYFISPIKLPPIDGLHLDRDLIAWADSTNLYIKARPDFGVEYYHPADLYDLYSQVGSNEGIGAGVLSLGKQSGLDRQGAIRFTGFNVAKNTTLASAELRFYVTTQVTTGGGNLKGKFYGIDEDNTGSFTGNPMSRTATSAEHLLDLAIPSPGNYFTQGVTAATNEILARSGWSSGNAIAFKWFNNGTNDDVYWRDAEGQNFFFGYYSESFLAIRRSDNLASYKYTIFKNQLQ